MFPDRIADSELQWTRADTQIVWWVRMRARNANLDCRQWDRLDALRMLEWQDDPLALAYAGAWDHIINIRGGGGVMSVAGYLDDRE